MPPNDELFLPYIEWEYMTNPLIITAVNEHERLPKGQKKITIARDSDYNLHAELEFQDADFGASYYSNQPPPGTFIKYFEVTGSNYSGSRHYTLESCNVNNVGMVIGDVEHNSPMKADLFLSEFRMKTNPEHEVVHLSEWCLNGPYMPVFSRNTARKLSKAYSRERYQSKDNKIESISITNSPSSHASDFLIVQKCEYQYIIEKVPEQLGPKWSSNIGIEYRY